MTSAAPAPLLTCRQQHAAWAETLQRSEQDIDQLLSLLADLPTDPCHLPRRYILDYASALNQLRTTIHRLRVDIVCSGSHCGNEQPATPCPDGRFVVQAVGTNPINGLAAEYDRLRTRCQSYLDELVGLNLL